jgi:hypothetical protein
MSREQILIRLHDLSGEKPTTKMGQIRWAWPEIKAALAAGHTLQRVHERLDEIGIEINYRTLSLYIGRLEREYDVGQPYPTAAAQQAEKGASSASSPATESRPVAATRAALDPFANIRREREKKRGAGFEFDAFSTNKNLLE